MRLVVVGAGIAGLVAAYEARTIAGRTGIDLHTTILEAEPRAGGKLFTEHEGGTALEWGPDSFLASKPAARELAEVLGLELVQQLPESMRAFLLLDGDLRPFPPGLVMGVPRGPTGVMGAVRSGIVGAASAARVAVEPMLPGRWIRAAIDKLLEETDRDESAARVVRRRLGRSWSSRVVEPLLEGVYGAPAEQLGVRATLPQFALARSLVLAARRTPPAQEPMFLSIRGGMGRLAERIEESLQDADLRLRTPALAVSRRDGAFSVAIPDGEIEADAIILAVPAPAARGLIQQIAPSVAGELGAIRFSSSAVVLLRYEPGALGSAPDGSGYLVPRREGLMHAACSWLTSKWPGEGADVWLRAIVTSPVRLRDDDAAIGDLVATEVDSVMHMTTGPAEVRVHRWEHALPVYAPGHLERVDRIEAGLPARIALAGASYRGLGVPDCIASGRRAAARLTEAART